MLVLTTFFNEYFILENCSHSCLQDWWRRKHADRDGENPEDIASSPDQRLFACKLTDTQWVTDSISVVFDLWIFMRIPLVQPWVAAGWLLDFVGCVLILHVVVVVVVVVDVDVDVVLLLCQVEMEHCKILYGNALLKRFHVETKLKDVLQLSDAERVSVLQYGKKICK